MKEIKYEGHITPEERETIITYSEIDKKWTVDTTIPRHYRKFLKQGWAQTSITTDSNGSFIAAEFENGEKAISIRNISSATKRTLSDEHLAKLMAARQNRTEK